MPALLRRPVVISGAVGAIVLGVAIYLAVASAAGTSPTPVAATPTPSPSPTPTPTPSPTPSPSPSPTPLPPQRVTLLVLGSDADAARIARGRAPLTDAIMVASVSADRDEITVISIPRDTVDIPMPDGSVWSRKINILYQELGIDATRGAVETLLDISIDHYVLLNMDDFAGLTNALGGVEVNVPFPMQDPKVRLSIGAGLQRMSGEVALKYARSRSLDSDYGRAGRQQDVVLALARAIADPTRAAEPAALLAALSSLQTDLDLAELPAALEVVRASSEATVTKVVLKPPNFALFSGLAGDRGWVMIPNVAEIRAFVAAAMTD